MNFTTTPVPHQVRRFHRADLDLYVNKIIGDEPHLARVRDISAGGLFLYKLIEPDTANGAKIGLELQLPNAKEVIWALGEVVREENCKCDEGVAVRFVRIAESDREMIRDYVDARRHADEVQAA